MLLWVDGRANGAISITGAYRLPAGEQYGLTGTIVGDRITIRSVDKNDLRHLVRLCEPTCLPFRTVPRHDDVVSDRAQFYDLTAREALTLLPLAAIVLVLGFWPLPILDLARTGLDDLLRHMMR